MQVVLSSLRVMLNCKQNEDSPQSYLKRFKANMEVMESHIGGPLALIKIVKGKNSTFDSMSADDQTEAITKQHDRFMAYLHMDNSDHRRYGGLLKTLSTDQSLGSGRYPESLEKAVDALATYKIDKQVNQSKNDKGRKGDKDKWM